MSRGDELMSEQELLRYLGISRPSAYRLRRDGRIRHLKVCGRIRYRRSDVEEFVRALMVESDGYTYLKDESGEWIPVVL